MSTKTTTPNTTSTTPATTSNTTRTIDTPINCTDVSDKTKLIPYVHTDEITVVPADYIIGKHKPLLMEDFCPTHNGVKNNYWFHAYKIQHLTWYAKVDIGGRINHHRECVANVNDPTAAAKMAMDKTITKFMKQTGQTRNEVIALLKNA